MNTNFTLFKEHARAFKASFYPGVSLTNAHTVVFSTDDYFEVLRMILFVG